jgi:TrpR-related protein YerC/YecD
MKQKQHSDGRRADLYKAFASIETEAEAEAFLGDLCTPAEIEAFADRWRAANMINDGIPYRQITAETGVSTATVTRVARFLNQGFDGYAAIIKKTKK